MWSNQENRVRKQVKNPCEARKIKASQILHKIISTHLLTVLTISAILITVMRKPLQAQPHASYFFKEPRRLRICIYKLKEESL